METTHLYLRLPIALNENDRNVTNNYDGGEDGGEFDLISL